MVFSIDSNYLINGGNDKLLKIYDITKSFELIK
jgi:hypothetical protein